MFGIIAPIIGGDYINFSISKIWNLISLH